MIVSATGAAEIVPPPKMHYVGIDGGGTKTTVGVANGAGREIARRVGEAGLVDARHPTASAERLVDLIRETMAAAGVAAPVAGLCAGLAGVGNAEERRVVERVLNESGVARRVAVISDGEAALNGALGGGAGILLIAGTGSVAHGRAEDGRLARCGGWGADLGDEGSGFAIGRSGLGATLLAVDGRSAETILLPMLMEAIGVEHPDAIPPWAARARKGEVAALAVRVIAAAGQGDVIARTIISEAALDLAAHVQALVRRLGPWNETPRVALHGGVARDPAFQPQLERTLEALSSPLTIVPAVADAVTGALECARQGAIRGGGQGAEVGEQQIVGP